jgi:hypothetical protein
MSGLPGYRRDRPRWEAAWMVDVVVKSKTRVDFSAHPPFTTTTSRLSTPPTGARMQLRDDALSSVEVVWKILEHRLGDKSHYGNDFAVSRAPALLLGSLLVLIAFCVLPRRCHASERSVISRNTEHGSRLAALSTIVAPTRSFWPPTFVDIARRSDKVVRIPLGLLLAECLSGRVSLRSRGDELSRLLNGSLAVRGRPIRLDVGAEWRLRVATWGGVQATWLRKKTITVRTFTVPFLRRIC